MSIAPIFVRPRRFAWIAAALCLAACARPEDAPEFQAACHGGKLTLEQHEQALTDGYAVHPRYRCIEKQSWEDEQARRAAWEAANTPEAKAKRAAEWAEQTARDQAERAERERADRARAEAEALAAAAQPPVDVSRVDANRASAERLAQVISLDADVAAQIVAAREQRPLRDWADLVARVPSFAAAKVAVYASSCGLVVNGESLEGAPPDAALATQIRDGVAQRAIPMWNGDGR